jgi:hypothetical protein
MSEPLELVYLYSQKKNERIFIPMGCEGFTTFRNEDYVISNYNTTKCTALVLYPENGGSRLLRNVVNHL